MKFQSEKHNRAVRSIAQMVEEKLMDVENVLDNTRTHEPISVSIENDLSQAEENEVREIIGNIYALLRQFTEHYEIGLNRFSAKKELAFKAALLWQEISGATGRSMDSYGSLDEAQKEEFEQYTTSMTEMVNDLYLICK